MAVRESKSTRARTRLRSGLYSVLYDENKFNADDIQQAIYATTSAFHAFSRALTGIFDSHTDSLFRTMVIGQEIGTGLVKAGLRALQPPLQGIFVEVWFAFSCPEVPAVYKAFSESGRVSTSIPE